MTTANRQTKPQSGLKSRLAKLRTSLSLLSTALDANERRLQAWAAMLTGAAMGLAWGAIARIWMRLIATNPEFSVGGTAIILAIPTLFGTCAGLALVARRRGWTGWRHYLPRTLTVIFFIPFGFAGGGPLMLTVLLATLAVTWPAAPRAVTAAVALLIVAVTAALGQTLVAAVPLVALTLTYAAWIFVARRASERGMQLLKLWRSRIARGSLLVAAVGVFVAVSVQIITDKPGMFGPAYVAMYLLLLGPLFLGLWIGLQPAAPPHRRGREA
jgi:hypothetical protein